MTAGPDPWRDALWASLLVSVDPGLGGIALRARAGPVREDWLALHRGLGVRLVRMPPTIEDDRLLGGLDLPATLASGRPVMTAGLLADTGDGTLVLPMAERAGAGLAARLGAAWDAGAPFTLIALDEGAEPDERMPDALADRMAFRIDLNGDCRDRTPGHPVLAQGSAAARAAARDRLATLVRDPADAAVFVEAAAALGIASLRAPLLALRAARAAAAALGENTVTPEAARLAARLVLGPRARQMPQVEEDESEPPPPPPPPDDPETGEAPEADTPKDPGKTEIPTEILLDAVRASLPPDTLARLAAAGALRLAGAQGAGAGDDQKGAKRGRPAGVTRGDPRGKARLDLVATLRAAAPWQPIRRAMLDASHTPGRVLVRADDFRVRRYRQKAERLVIFAVDASGSTALARLAEAKGAIELMLAEAYVRREQVALIAFRGSAAELLLPPTRSLVQTKRRLSALPGGGGTPLAAGLEAVLALADLSRRKGVAPALVLLTDGKANIARDGTPGRPQAQADAAEMARALRATRLPALVIDTSPRAQPQAEALARDMGARCILLPRADARQISRTIGAALDAAGVA